MKRAVFLLTLILTWPLQAAPNLALTKGMQAVWSWGPGPALAAGSRLAATASGAWVLPNPRVLSGPKGAVLLLHFDAADMDRDSQGRLWFATDRAAGTLDPLPDLRSADLKVRLLLPGPAWRLADGREQGMLAWGPDTEAGGTSVVRLRDRRLLLRWPEPLSAVAATPKGLALATPGGLLRVDAAGKAETLPLPLAARSLAWVEGAGLVASAQGRLWLLPEGGRPVPFMDGADARVRAAGPDLHILLPAQGGVLRLRGLQTLVTP